jgi:hypothetical protein
LANSTVSSFFFRPKIHDFAGVPWNALDDCVEDGVIARAWSAGRRPFGVVDGARASLDAAYGLELCQSLADLSHVP